MVFPVCEIDLKHYYVNLRVTVGEGISSVGQSIVIRPAMMKIIYTVCIP